MINVTAEVYENKNHLLKTSDIVLVICNFMTQCFLFCTSVFLLSVMLSSMIEIFFSHILIENETGY